MLNNRLLRLPLLALLVIGIFPTFAFALDAPKDLRGTEVKQNTVKWEWAAVPGASKYEITVDWKVVDLTGNTSIKSYNLFAGDHYMSVRAVAYDGTKSAPSQTAKIITSRTFSYDDFARSTLMGDQPANDGGGTTSAGFGIPQGVWGKEISPQTVKWGWERVDGAMSYDVFVDGKYNGSTGGTEWTVGNLWIGTHSMTVKAVSRERKISNHSKTVRLAVIGNGNGGNGGTSPQGGSVGIPSNTRGEEYSAKDVRWKWDAVSGASKYEVTVDGKWAGETGNTEWVSKDLWVGTHSMTVKARSSNGSWSGQSKTAKVYVNGYADEGAPEPSPPPPEPDAGEGGGNPDAVNVQSFIDPESYNYSEVTGKSGWELTFSDEFNGTALNPYRWHSQLRWDGEWNGERYEYRIINGESQFYVNTLSPDSEHQNKIVPLHNPFKFNGNRMAIQAARNPLKDKSLDRNFGRLEDVARQQPFLSGAISTHDKFAQKYGYFEARIRIPSHVGTFPAFWLFHERRAWEGTQRTEIDIMENLGHAPWYVYNSFHYFKNVSTTYSGDANFVKPKPSGQIYSGTDYSQDYHVYAVEWSPGKIVWYIDGQQVSELYNGEVDFEELYVMLNLAMGGNWTNFPTNAGGLGRPGDQRYPTGDDINQFSNPQLEIDYVRVFKRK